MNKGIICTLAGGIITLAGSLLSSVGREERIKDIVDERIIELSEDDEDSEEEEKEP